MTASGSSPVEEEVSRLQDRIKDLEGRLRRKEADAAALTESRSLFDAFLSNIPALAWVKDEHGAYVYANHRMHRYIERKGLSWSELNHDELWPAAVADCFRKADSEVISANRAASSKHEIGQGEGTLQWLVSRFPVITRNNKRYCASVAEDITEKLNLKSLIDAHQRAEQTAKAQAASSLQSLHSAESRAERLFQSKFCGLLECEGASIVGINDTLLAWIGARREDFLDKPRKWREIIVHPFPISDSDCLEHLRLGGKCGPYEQELATSSRQTVPATISLTPLDRNGSSFLIEVLHREENRESQSRLLRSQKLGSLGIIAGGVAHDLNNMLATIMGNASMSLDALYPGHLACTSLEEVVIASRKASELTQQMLAYAGRANFIIRTLDLSEMVREIGRLLETTISKKIDLTYDLAEDLPGTRGDAGQVQQVVLNLVINASDAVGENPGEVRVSTYHSGPQGSGFVCFEVRDTGCGMSEETRKRIFDPFFTTKRDGRGLGLACVLNIVKNHGGRMTVESAPGAGTIFRVYFPESFAEILEEPEGTNTQLSGTETILVVDDDEGIRRMTKASLERFGYQVLTASDGQCAVQEYREHTIAISAILLDWAMPVMNGEEALRQILEMNPEAKVLLSSGYAETETMQRIGTGGLAGFLQKPYTTTQLAGRLREILGPAH